jgi:hypothetical protein
MLRGRMLHIEHIDDDSILTNDKLLSACPSYRAHAKNVAALQRKEITRKAIRETTMMVFEVTQQADGNP